MQFVTSGSGMNCVEWKWKDHLKRCFFNNQHDLSEHIDLRFVSLKNIYASFSSIYLDLGGGLYFGSTTTNASEDRFFKLDKQVRLFVSSPLCDHSVIVFEDNTTLTIDNHMYIFPPPHINQISSPIKLVGCSCRSDIFITEDNKMYVRGDNKHNVQNGVVAKGSILYAPTPFENESPVVDVKCGYFHTVVLLENFKIYACGRNNEKQCGVSGVNDTLFIEIRLSEAIHPTKLHCAYSDTGFISKYDTSSFLFGDITSSMENIPDNQYLHQPFELASGVKGHKIALEEKGLNAVSAGFSHYVCYKKKDSLVRFLNHYKMNLKKLALQYVLKRGEKLTDISINFNL